MLKAGANLRANRNAPLEYAISNSNLSSVISFLRAGKDPRCRQDWPLRHACRNDAAEMVRILLAHRADADASNGMPLHEALRAGNHDIARQLLEHGTGPSSIGALRGLSDAIRSIETRTSYLIIIAMDPTASNVDSNYLFIGW